MLNPLIIVVHSFPALTRCLKFVNFLIVATGHNCVVMIPPLFKILWTKYEINNNFWSIVFLCGENPFSETRPILIKNSVILIDETLSKKQIPI